MKDDQHRDENLGSEATEHSELDNGEILKMEILSLSVVCRWNQEPFSLSSDKDKRHRVVLARICYCVRSSLYVRVHV